MKGWRAMANGRAPVLVVEDEPLMRSLLTAAIQQSGADVIAAADGVEGLEKFRECRSTLIVSDVRMPHMDGLALLRAVRALEPTAAVVLVTGYDDEEMLRQVRESGADYVLSKPFRLDDIKRIVTRVCGPTRGADPELVTQDVAMRQVVERASRVARTDATVLIEGETGTGKEVLARWIHREGIRGRGPFIAVNCAALPETLIEAELFGHERGAFTGAVGRRVGVFEAANGGTLLLDEVTEIPVGVQAKLLRALQEREVVRVGSAHAVKVDTRVIAVTNRDIRSEVSTGHFRADLYFRLAVIRLRVPALRERVGDVRILSEHFVGRYGTIHGGTVVGVTEDAVRVLEAHGWPGNVRELENVIQRAVILCAGREIGVEHLELEGLAAGTTGALTGAYTVAEMERELILATLKRLGGNRTHTARALGVSVRTIRNRLREYRALGHAAQTNQLD
jgi:two-component system response regulator FlrC